VGLEAREFEVGWRTAVVTPLYPLLAFFLLLAGCAHPVDPYVADLCNPTHGICLPPCEGDDCECGNQRTLCCQGGECRSLSEEEELTRTPNCDGGVVGVCHSWQVDEANVGVCYDVPWHPVR